ncbi:MAG TPA: hypothetical protein VK843_09685 [Planctomycetota bacterium]|nr:hypothetical protein [Planctomycetota bacterium]
MEDHVLGGRGRTLEEEFFRKEEAKLLERLRAQKQKLVTREGLQQATGISDSAAIDRLLAMGISPQTLTALALVPLVQVAWASGGVEIAERKLILEAAKDAGLDSAGQELLASWLAHAPDRALLDAWRGYVSTMCKEVAPQQRETMKTELLGRARKVAGASGGMLALGSVSKEEQKVLKELESAFN